MDEAESGDWLSIQQVAKRLGVSADTIRRRLKRGELAARRDDTPQGYRWLIRIDAPSVPPDAPGSPRTRETHPQGSTTLMLVDDARDDLIATLRDELANRVREVAELHTVILSQARALESVTSAALPAGVIARDHEDETEPVSPQTRHDGPGATIAASPSMRSNEGPARVPKTGFARWWTRISGR